ncbi:MAG: transposase [Chlamydiales bacterium]|nr:transposase [Chlamydiales bacterium]
MIKSDVFTLISIFCDVDDFCKEFEPEWKKILIENQHQQLIGNKKKRNRKTELSLSEAITIVIMFHKTRYRTFKDYYQRYNDRIPVSDMSRGLFGKLFGDKGYISQELFLSLYEKGMQIITKLKKNMKNKPMSLVH